MIDAAARLQHARHFGERLLRLRHVVQHQHQRRHVEPFVVDRQRLELAAPKVDVVEARQTPLRGLQHRRRGVDGNDARDERRERRADLTGAAAEIADDRVAVGQRGERRQVHAIAEQLVAQAIPLAGRGREELLRFGATVRQRHLEAALILHRRRRRAHLFADQQPQPARGGIELVARHRVEVAGALGARRDPAAVGERLQVAADRRLRQLHDGAELGHGQLRADRAAAAGGCGSRRTAR